MRSKNQASEEAALYLGPAAVEALLAIRPHEAVIDPGASVFGMSAGQVSRRIKAATKMAGLGDGFSAHSPRAADGVLSPVVQTLEMAVRKTGLLTARRNPEDRKGPVCTIRKAPRRPKTVAP